MTDAERYKKEQDRVFQEIEAMEELERKADNAAAINERWDRLTRTPRQAEFVMKVLDSRGAIRRLLDTSPSTEERWAMIEELVEAWKRRHPEP
jgi:hypothetical protein